MRALTRLLERIGGWLNARLHIVATPEESAIYGAIDDELEAKGQ